MSTCSLGFYPPSERDAPPGSTTSMRRAAVTIRARCERGQSLRLENDEKRGWSHAYVEGRQRTRSLYIHVRRGRDIIAHAGLNCSHIVSPGVASESRPRRQAPGGPVTRRTPRRPPGARRSRGAPGASGAGGARGGSGRDSRDHRDCARGRGRTRREASTAVSRLAPAGPVDPEHHDQPCARRPRALVAACLSPSATMAIRGHTMHTPFEQSS